MGDRARCTIIVGIGMPTDNDKVLRIFEIEDSFVLFADM